MTSTDNQTIPPSSRSTYQVFLSFRGADTRCGFTGHLYEALISKGIRTFRDDVEIERGEDIASELLLAIEESKVFVIIFSENYARSRWCLDELVMIYECKARKRPLILPIFYHVDPSEVRHQTGRYGEALVDHEREANPEKKANIQKWRAALTEAGNTSGHDLQRYRYESNLVKQIVSDVHKRLNCKMLHISENIVGMDSHLEKLKPFIKIESNVVRMIGIWGIGGIGKTTIAKAFYNSISYQFDGSSFLDNVRGTKKCSDLLELQRKLLYDILKGRDLKFHGIDEGINVIRDRLHSKRVLIVVDNVDDLCQLECIIGKNGWFCPGSRIIITTRDKHLLDVHGVDVIYEPKELNYDESVELFCQHAFKQSHCRDDFKNILNRAVNYGKGLPLALKFLGDHLFNKTIAEWESSLCKQERQLHPELQSVLRMSFEGLDDTEKEIFLDIACFFKGKDKDFVLRILDGSDFFGESGIRVLVDKSLLTVSNNKLDMHDLLQQMGWEIVRKICLREPGKRSRLWDNEDVSHVLTRNTGTKTIEGIMLDLSTSKPIKFTTKAFKRMKRLRVLKVHRDGHYECVEKDPKDVQIGHLCQEKLVELSLQSSSIIKLLDKKLVFEKLKVLNVSYSQHLIEIPNASSFPKLEILSIKGCGNLRCLPSGIYKLKHLKSLCCSGCSKVEVFPEVLEEMENLRELYLDGTGIRNLPWSIDRLKGVEFLDLGHCENLESLPETLCNLTSLKKLIACSCPTLHVLPSILSISLQGRTDDVLSPFTDLGISKCERRIMFWRQKLERWKPGSPELGSQPYESPKPKNPDMGILILSDSCSWHLLEELDLSYCNLVGREFTRTDKVFHLPSLLALNLSGNHFLSVPPKDINKLSKLRILKMAHCELLQEIPELPSNLREIDAHGCPSLFMLQKWKQTQLSGSLLNCFKSDLQDCEGGYGWSDGFILGSQCDGKGINLLVDGSVGVPEWIKHQTMGNEVVMELPLNWYEDNDLLGFSFFSFHVPLSGSKDPSPPGSSSTLKCELAFHGEQSGIVDDLFWDSSCDCYKNGDASHQVWVTYYPKIAVKEMYHSNGYRFLKASFGGKSMKVEKCGMDLICARDDRRGHSCGSLGYTFDDKGSTSESSLHHVKRRSDDAEQEYSSEEYPHKKLSLSSTHPSL